MLGHGLLKRLDGLVDVVKIGVDGPEVALSDDALVSQFCDEGVTRLVKMSDEFWGHSHEDIHCREGDDPETPEFHDGSQPAEIECRGARGEESGDAGKNAPGRKFCLEDHFRYSAEVIGPWWLRVVLASHATARGSSL